MFIVYTFLHHAKMNPDRKKMQKLSANDPKTNVVLLSLVVHFSCFALGSSFAKFNKSKR